LIITLNRELVEVVRHRDLPLQGGVGLPSMLFLEHRQEIQAHGGILVQALSLFLENRVAYHQLEPGSGEIIGLDVAEREASEIQISSSQVLIFGAAAFLDSMEVEEAVVVALLAVGMSVLVALTIMLFW
jgi:hypothetical protein